MGKVAVLGFGTWGKNLVRNFYELGALGAVCDSNPARRKEFEKTYPGIGSLASVDDVLARQEIQGIVIATPAASHFDLARRALVADRDVFVEKPLALDVGDAEVLVELAAKRRRVLMVGHILRYHPAVVALKELIDRGELGRINYLYSNRLNMGRIRTEENILWSFAPHDISVMLYLLGEEPVSVACQGGAYLSQSVPDVTTSEFLFPSGVRAHIFVSWLHPFKEQRLVVVGSEKMAVFDDMAEEKLVVYPHRVEWRNRVPTAVKAAAQRVKLPEGEPLRLECQHFLECMRERRTPRTDGQEGIRVLRLLTECQSLLTGKEYGTLHRRPSGGSAEGGGTLGSTSFFAHETACIEPGCEIGEGTKIWHFSHVMSGARIGRGCVLGQNCNVDRGVKIGDGVKIQNNVSVYSGAVIEDNVFLGPSCVLTNVTNPRSEVSRRGLYEKTVIRRGATIGANATIVCGVEIGRYAFVGAGAVVTSDVPDYALVVGNPARQIGWMSRHGQRLGPPDADGIMTCPESGLRYRLERDGVVRCIDLPEDAELPSSQKVSRVSYHEFKSVGSFQPWESGEGGAEQGQKG